MKVSAVIVSRNDNYGGNLNERATYCFNSAIDTYDEVIYVDWNSPTHSLLYDIQTDIKFKGNFKHIAITPEIAAILTGGDPYAQKCCEVLARNIGLRRATGDWLISTNIDIIHPKREDLEAVLGSVDSNTFYTISRRHTDWEIIKDFNHGESHTNVHFSKWKELREYLIEHSEERHFDEKTVEGDDYSIINCCGDFQIAPKHIWNEIRGMEEDLIYSLYADTNVQKKAVMHGFNLKALYNPALFHIA
ncbi:MAG: hypothetical protein EBU90_29525, partial [Proteobacteria bacterium]|nr:hypothetical protein [Pseudomonadota bacterium]